MAWNSANAVPWKRLWIEWAVIGVGIALVSAISSKHIKPENLVAIILGGLVYVVLGAVLAKFGYQRKTLKQIRKEAAAAQPRQVGRTSAASSASTAGARQRPAPTSRTSSAPRKPAPKRKR